MLVAVPGNSATVLLLHTAVDTAAAVVGVEMGEQVQAVSIHDG